MEYEITFNKLDEDYYINIIIQKQLIKNNSFFIHYEIIHLDVNSKIYGNKKN